MLVDRMIRRRVPGCSTASCACAGRAPYRGSTSTPASPCRLRRTRSISPAPGRNTSTSPSSCTASTLRIAAAVRTSSVPSIPSAQVTSTGNGRPSTSTIGQSKRNALTSRGSIVADMTIRRRSSRARMVSRQKARARSAWTDRSWNSSMMTQDTPSSSGSSMNRRVRMPSVTTRIRVSFEWRPKKRTWNPTVRPTGSSRSAAMWDAQARAAMRRGSSSRICPCPTLSDAASVRGTRVVFPAPGGAVSTTAPWRHSSSGRPGSTSSMGRGGSCDRSMGPS